MLHLNCQVRLEAGQGGQEVIEDLFGCRAELSTTRAYLQPANLITVIALRPSLAADEDGVTVVGQFHVSFGCCGEICLAASVEGAWGLGSA